MESKNKIQKNDWLAYVAYVFFGGGLIMFVYAITWPAVRATAAGKPFPKNWNWGTIVLFDVMFSVLCFYAMWWVFQAFSTRVTEEGISQRQLTGRVFIQWTQMRAVQRRSDTFRLVADHATIDVAIFVFKQPQALLDFVSARLPTNINISFHR